VGRGVEPSSLIEVYAYAYDNRKIFCKQGHAGFRMYKTVETTNWNA